MFPITCKNCGELNMFLSLPPRHVRCQSCGRYFRTDKGGAPPSDERGRRSLQRSLAAKLDFAMIREQLGAMYPVICTHCDRVNLLFSPPPALAPCDHFR